MAIVFSQHDIFCTFNSVDQDPSSFSLYSRWCKVDTSLGHRLTKIVNTNWQYGIANTPRATRVTQGGWFSFFAMSKLEAAELELSALKKSTGDVDMVIEVYKNEVSALQESIHNLKKELENEKEKVKQLLQ